MVKTTGDGWLNAKNVGVLTDPRFASELAKFVRQSLWRKREKAESATTPEANKRTFP